MYGKCYESMYEGSMIGAGINVFAVWNYIIAKARAGVIEINPKLLAFTLGGTEKEVESALEFLQQPDPESRSKLEGGRRIIREGQFQYRLVNWEYYQQIKNENDRREYNRRKQAEYRAKKAASNGGTSLENKKDLRRQAKVNKEAFAEREAQLAREIDEERVQIVPER